MNKPVEPGQRVAAHALPAIVQSAPRSILLDPTLFDQAQRAAKAMALSPLFPAHLRSGGTETAIANAVLVLNIAYRLGEDPLTVGQNIYFVGGKPGWSASYMISRANMAGVFRGRIGWRFQGEGGDLVVTAYATLADTGEEVAAEASMRMAKAEAWVKNTKYASMPRQMLQYRAATLLIRLYCPEVMLGYQTAEEIEDVRAAGAEDATPEMRDITPPAKAKPAAQKAEPEKSKAAVAKPAAKAPAAEVASPKPKPKREAKPVAPAEPIPPEVQSVVDRIVEDLAEQGDAGSIEASLEMWEDQIAFLSEHHPAAHQIVQEAADAARERLA